MFNHVWVSLKHYADNLTRKNTDWKADEREDREFFQDITMHKNFLDQFKGTCDAITVKNMMFIVMECFFFLVI